MRELAAEVAAQLANRDLAVSASRFPTDRAQVARPGLYSWWVDEVGRAVLERSLGADLPDLIYVGQAGATSTRSGKSSTATLGSRILNNHIRGTAYGSTFRKSISAVLLAPLGLVVERKDHLSKDDNDRVSAWIREHLSVVVYPYDDVDPLHALEAEVLRILDPPLNLDGMTPTSIRQTLSALRREVSRPASAPVVGETDEVEADLAGVLELAGEVELGDVRFMIPTGGPDDWRRLLADPELHWVVGRSARTMAHAWEDAGGWPGEVESAFRRVPDLAGLEPVYGFPEFKTPLPGGRRASQTDLMVIATDGTRRATVAIEGKVDETFGEIVREWLGPAPSPGKMQRLDFLADLLSLDIGDLPRIRYQLVHRTAAAKLEAARNGSDIAVMLVHSWGRQLEGFSDFAAFAELLGAEAKPGEIQFSETADLWIGWVAGDPKYLVY